MSEGMFVALLVAGVGFLILLGTLAWGMLELRRQARDDDDQMMRDLEQ